MKDENRPHITPLPTMLTRFRRIGMIRGLLLLFIAAAMTAACIPASGKKVRTNLKVEKTKKEMPEAITASADRDTVFITKDNLCKTFRPDSIRFTGYDKKVTASKESFLLVNHSDAVLKSIEIRIVYRDMKRRMLHSRTVEQTCHVPSGETRLIEIGSWDRQKSYFYYLSDNPRRISTPYMVEIIPVRYTIE